MAKIFQVVFAPGATTAGETISLPTGSPSISSIVSAVIYDPTTGASSATATKAGDTSITLDTNTTATQLLIFAYIPKGAIKTVGFG